MIDLKFTPFARSDCLNVFHWRNRKNIRQSMKNVDRIEYQEHCKWFSKQLTFVEPRNWIYKNEKILGVCYFKECEANANAIIWGFYLVSEPCHGGGYQMCYDFSRLLSQVTTAEKIQSYIKLNNIASIRIHEKLGFKNIDTDQSNEFYKYEKIINA